VQNGDIKEASSVFWPGGITRTQENCHTAWGKDLYYRHQSGICLMRGSIIVTHAFVTTRCPPVRCTNFSPLIMVVVNNALLGSFMC
jgi:hypothetical protein